MTSKNSSSGTATFQGESVMDATLQESNARRGLYEWQPTFELDPPYTVNHRSYAVVRMLVLHNRNTGAQTTKVWPAHKHAALPLVTTDGRDSFNKALRKMGDYETDKDDDVERQILESSDLRDRRVGLGTSAEAERPLSRPQLSPPTHGYGSK
jgi:hypothetical protein